MKAVTVFKKFRNSTLFEEVNRSTELLSEISKMVRRERRNIFLFCIIEIVKRTIVIIKNDHY
jgi:hypothetical protein